jgi:hypothetical protein
MATLAVVEGGLQACRNATRTASLPTTALQLPTLTETTGVSVAPIKAVAPVGEDATAGGGRTKAWRTGGIVCDDVK